MEERQKRGMWGRVYINGKREREREREGFGVIEFKGEEKKWCVF